MLYRTDDQSGVRWETVCSLGSAFQGGRSQRPAFSFSRADAAARMFVVGGVI
jgi:hypothetical protein